MKPNPGYCPSEALGKRVRVRLANGEPAGNVDPSFPPGWPADGKGACNWLRTGHPFDVAEFEVIA